MLPSHQKIIQHLKQLSKNEDIQAIALFGSAARDQLTKKSDIDAIIITTNPQAMGHTIHPQIYGTKLDISASTIKDFEKEMEKQAAKNDRIPMIGESKIIFDKTGDLTKLQSLYRIKPNLSQESRQFCKFMITHNHQKVLNAQGDSLKVLFLIGTNLEDTLNRHYLLQGKWRIADKRILHDLQSFDPHLYSIVTELITESNPQEKLKKWIQVHNYICKANNINSVEETSCQCEYCQSLMQLIHDEKD